MSGSVGASSGSSGIQAAQQQAQAQFEQNSIKQMEMESKFSEEQALSGFGNTIAKANPGQ